MVAARGAKEAKGDLAPVEVRGNKQIKSKIAKPKVRHAEEKFLRLMFEAATSAMIMVNDRGLITLVNPRTEQLFRYRWKELLEQRIEMLVRERYRSAHPDHRQGFFQHPTTGTLGAGRDWYGLRNDGGKVRLRSVLILSRQTKGRSCWRASLTSLSGNRLNKHG